MRRVEIEARIARMTISKQQLSTGLSQTAMKHAKKTETQSIKTLKRLVAQHNSPQEKMCVDCRAVSGNDARSHYDRLNRRTYDGALSKLRQ